MLIALDGGRLALQRGQDALDPSVRGWRSAVGPLLVAAKQALQTRRGSLHYVRWHAVVDEGIEALGDKALAVGDAGHEASAV